MVLLQGPASVSRRPCLGMARLPSAREAPLQKDGVKKPRSKFCSAGEPQSASLPIRGRKKSNKTPSTFVNRSQLHFGNIRGLNSNLNSVHHHLQSSCPLVLGLSETQISIPLSSNHLSCPGYDLYSGFYSKGGVCLYVRSDCRANSLSNFDISCGDFQIIWIKLFIGSCCCAIAMVYRSPNSVSDDRFFASLSYSTESLMSSIPGVEIIIMGDFNVHNSNWLSCSRYSDPAGLELENFCTLNNLDQLVKGPTRIPDRAGDFASTLDLFLTSHLNSYLDVVISAPLGTSDHNLISLVRPSFAKNSPKRTKRCLWNFLKADWDGFRDFIGQFPWTDLLLCSSASDCADKITEILQVGMKCFIPFTYSPGLSSSPKWFSSECSAAVKEKDVLFKAFKANPSSENRDAYRCARNYCSLVIDKAKKDFINRKASKLSSCPAGSRAFWSLSNAICNNFCNSSFPPIVHLDGSSAVDSFDKANIFADTFAANSTISNCNSPSLIPTVPDSKMSCFKISTRSVRRLMQALNPRKATGPDDIPPIVMIKCAPELAPVLCRLYKLCLSSGVCPSSWKSAHVVPVPKKGNRSDPSNYRPIAITSVLCKIFESLISDAIFSFLKSRNFVNDRQYGFQKCRSTGDLLSYVTNKWSQVVDRFGETVAVALDISKAFDRVWHEGLMFKLSCLGIHPALISWIKDFLCDRSISVRVDGILSDYRNINCGVPQGCVLSPLLFLVYINDLLSCSNNEIHSFADDSTLHSSISYSSQAQCSHNLPFDRTSQQNSLNSDLVSILDWGVSNRVNFNDKKTQVVKISLKHNANPSPLTMAGTELPLNSSISMLGVSISEGLSWKTHIHQVARNASRRLGILFRSRHYFSSLQLLILFKAQVRPVMEYCCHLWAGSSACDLSILDRLQNKAIRLINDPNLTDSLATLSHRREVSCLSLFYRYYHGRCSSELAAAVPCHKSFVRSTRAASSSNPFAVSVPRSRTKLYKNSFFPRTSVMWNSLPLDCFPLNYDLQKFKVAVNKLPLCSNF